jgi:DNA-binding transcriptional LysR family regulator
MDIYLNVKAFLATVEAGNFSAAARSAGAPASVISKRVGQLEHQLHAKLFTRTTRHVLLTEAGQNYLERMRLLASNLDALLSGAKGKERQIEEFLRVKVPTVLGSVHFGPIFTQFLNTYPKVRIEVVLLNQVVSPMIGRFDMIIGLHTQSFNGVVEEHLCMVKRAVCASPEYLRRRGPPEHPRDLVRYDCLSSVADEGTWQFMGPRGIIAVQLRPRLNSTDWPLVLDAALAGQGIANLPTYVANDFLRAGGLVPVLVDYPVPQFSLRAMIPEHRAGNSAIRALLQDFKTVLMPVPPWERPVEPDRLQRLV